MALIACPDCGTQVSDSARACPKCARPMAATTIEQTGKQWKAAQLGFVLLGFSGCIMTLVTAADHSSTGQAPTGPPIGALLFFLGVLGYFGARIGAWWKHG